MFHFLVLLTLAVIYLLVTATLYDIFHENKGLMAKGLKFVLCASWPILLVFLIAGFSSSV